MDGIESSEFDNHKLDLERNQQFSFSEKILKQKAEVVVKSENENLEQKIEQAVEKILQNQN